VKQFSACFKRMMYPAVARQVVMYLFGVKASGVQNGLVEFMLAYSPFFAPVSNIASVARLHFIKWFHNVTDETNDAKHIPAAGKAFVFLKKKVFILFHTQVDGSRNF
jgi:hypothetical protein